MRRRMIAGFFVLTLVLVQACRQPRPLMLICLLDMSGSIETAAQESQFDALKPLLSQLKRGDTLVVIPITGDALTEAQGNILRFQLSTRRAAYDSDLKDLQREVQEKLHSLRDATKRKPHKQTDILGALEICAEEASAASPSARIAIVVLSDFIHDDEKFNFARDARLANGDRAAALARELALTRTVRLRNSSAYLGILRSEDLRRLPEARRQALRVFWTEYLRARGVAEVLVATDGTGQLAQFLEREQPGSEGKQLPPEHAE